MWAYCGFPTGSGRRNIHGLFIISCSGGDIGAWRSGSRWEIDSSRSESNAKDESCENGIKIIKIYSDVNGEWFMRGRWVALRQCEEEIKPTSKPKPSHYRCCNILTASEGAASVSLCGSVEAVVFEEK